jgi:UDP-N-acetylglucosamine--N-acetylmuramyl-(pentapeptide) pyrophosphoryl-undecaprenol N-acetylglucosamine transferase
MATRIIISGGGTGGHIYPAIAIADALKEIAPDTEVLFVGAEGKMEMEKVPQAGYKIIGLPVAGLQRNLSLQNLALPLKIWKSLQKAGTILKEFRPSVAVGVGGYASGPLLWSASQRNIPILIQEQNGYAGLTNKMLAKRADKICVAYQGMERFFPANKLIFTGNPVRKDILQLDSLKAEALRHFGLEEGKKTLLVLGGSLGARTLNQCLQAGYRELLNAGFQVIWSTGKYYYPAVQKAFEGINEKGLCIREFIAKMDYAYAASDVVISRSGALSVSELCLAGKPTIFVPSPNVAEDHQTKNAMALVNQQAGILIGDVEASGKLITATIDLLKDVAKQAKLSENIRKLGRPEAAITIAKEVLTLAGKK